MCTLLSLDKASHLIQSGLAIRFLQIHSKTFFPCALFHFCSDLKLSTFVQIVKTNKCEISINPQRAKPWDFKSLAATYQVRIWKVRLLKSESCSANFTLKFPAPEILIQFCLTEKVQMNPSCFRVIFAMMWHFNNQGVKSKKSTFSFSNSQKEERKWIKVILPLLSHFWDLMPFQRQICLKWGMTQVAAETRLTIVSGRFSNWRHVYLRK